MIYPLALFESFTWWARLTTAQQFFYGVGIIAMADVALETEDEREIAETLEEISSGAGFWKKN